MELGANEVLGSRSGVALVGAPPAADRNPATFAAQYDQILDRIEAVRVKHVLLVGLPTNPFVIPGLNQIYVPLKLAPVMQAGLQARVANLPPVPFTCAAGGPTPVDLVLTPAEQAIGVAGDHRSGARAGTERRVRPRNSDTVTTTEQPPVTGYWYR